MMTDGEKSGNQHSRIISLDRYELAHNCRVERDRWGNRRNGLGLMVSRHACPPIFTKCVALVRKKANN